MRTVVEARYIVSGSTGKIVSDGLPKPKRALDIKLSRRSGHERGVTYKRSR